MNELKGRECVHVCMYVCMHVSKHRIPNLSKSQNPGTFRVLFRELGFAMSKRTGRGTVTPVGRKTMRTPE